MTGLIRRGLAMVPASNGVIRLPLSARADAGASCSTQMARDRVEAASRIVVTPDLRHIIAGILCIVLMQHVVREFGNKRSERRDRDEQLRRLMEERH